MFDHPLLITASLHCVGVRCAVADADSFNEIFICDMIMNTGYNVVVCGKLLNDLSVTFVSPIVRHLYNFTQPLWFIFDCIRSFLIFKLMTHCMFFLYCRSFFVLSFLQVWFPLLRQFQFFARRCTSSMYETGRVIF